MKRAWTMIFLLAGLGGCAAVRQVAPVMPAAQQSPPFNEEETAMALRKGSNTIVGRSTFVTPNGQTVTCAGQEASLIPATPYSRWRMQALYGSASYVDVATAPRVPSAPSYARYTIRQPCDHSGHFRFTQVADGDYFVTTAVRWGSGPVRRTVSLRAEITVSGGGTHSIALGQ